MPDPIRGPICDARDYIDVEAMLTTIRDDESHLTLPPDPVSADALAERALDDIATAIRLQSTAAKLAAGGIALAGVAGLLSGPVSFPVAYVVGGAAVGGFIGLEAYALVGDTAEHAAARRSYSESMGAFAVLLAGPSFQPRGDRPPGFDEGVRQAKEYAAEHPERFEAFSAEARAASTNGRLSVALGDDAGTCFLDRYANDFAFHAGVVYMRELRERDPAAFDAEATRLVRLTRQVEQGRSEVRM